MGRYLGVDLGETEVGDVAPGGGSICSRRGLVPSDDWRLSGD